MIPYQYIFLAYLYGIICVACHFLLPKYSSIFRLSDWFYLVVLGWIIEPFAFMIWWLKRTSKWIDNIW